jgi:hypothetical protein
LRRLTGIVVALFGKRLGILAATTCTLGSSVAIAEPFHEDALNGLDEVAYV